MQNDHSAREPEWVEHAIWWQIYPLGLVGAPLTADPEHAASAYPPPSADGFERMTAWLDYAIELGASGLLLGPVFSSETHGYDTVDYFRIDPRLGDDDAFRTFIDQAHRRGLRILLDGVFNHVGRGFDAFQRAREAGAASSESRWFRPLGAGADDAEPRFENFEGHDALVALNHDEPAVADFVTTVMTHWLDVGVDGWRLDAAYAVPTAFWSTVLPRVREGHPDAYFFGEVIHGDYPRIVADSGVDSVTQYELWKAIWSGIDDRNLFELAHALGRHNGYLEAFAPVTFVGNHDVTRIANAITDQRHLAHALVVLFTVGGTPTIYYGDERALRGIKEERVGGDDAIRPEYPADGPDALGPDGEATFHLHQELIGIRRRHPWLHRATTTQLELTNTGFVYELRPPTAAGDGRMVVGLNLSDQDLAAAVEGELAVIAGDAATSNTDGTTTITVPAHGWAILTG